MSNPEYDNPAEDAEVIPAEAYEDAHGEGLAESVEEGETENGEKDSKTKKRRGRKAVLLDVSRLLRLLSILDLEFVYGKSEDIYVRKADERLFEEVINKYKKTHDDIMIEKLETALRKNDTLLVTEEGVGRNNVKVINITTIRGALERISMQEADSKSVSRVSESDVMSVIRGMANESAKKGIFFNPKIQQAQDKYGKKKLMERAEKQAEKSIEESVGLTVEKLIESEDRDVFWKGVTDYLSDVRKMGSKLVEKQKLTKAVVWDDPNLPDEKDGEITEERLRNREAMTHFLFSIASREIFMGCEINTAIFVHGEEGIGKSWFSFIAAGGRERVNDNIKTNDFKDMTKGGFELSVQMEDKTMLLIEDMGTLNDKDRDAIKQNLIQPVYEPRRLYKNKKAYIYVDYIPQINANTMWMHDTTGDRRVTPVTMHIADNMTPNMDKSAGVEKTFKVPKANIPAITKGVEEARKFFYSNMLNAYNIIKKREERERKIFSIYEFNTAINTANILPEVLCEKELKKEYMDEDPLLNILRDELSHFMEDMKNTTIFIVKSEFNGYIISKYKDNRGEDSPTAQKIKRQMKVLGWHEPKRALYVPLENEKPHKKTEKRVYLYHTPKDGGGEKREFYNIYGGIRDRHLAHIRRYEGENRDVDFEKKESSEEKGEENTKRVNPDTIPF